MEEEFKSFDLQEFIQVVKPKEIFGDQVIVMEILGSEIGTIPSDIFPLKFEAHSCMLVCRGELVMTMDYIPYTLTQNMVLERSNSHLMDGFQVSHDFRGYHVMFGKRILRYMFEEIVSVPREFALSKRFEPLLKLQPSESKMLIEIIERLRANLRRVDHYFQKGLVLNEVRNLVMELSNIGIKKVKANEDKLEISHFEDLAIRFMQLLVEKCRQWHEVSDYSTELCVTPVYLSRTVKSLSRMTAMDWINKARVAEAKILLRKSDNTVQHVADLMNFSDQSAFGKFFKKHTGKSPVEYKRQLDAD